jgi:hypothetical protein
MMKLKIRMGSSEIELEGDSSELHEILERHWEPHIGELLSGVHDELEVTGQTPDTPRKRKSLKSSSGKTRSAKSPASKSSDGDTGFEETVANQIKNESNFQFLNKKFIIASPPLVERCKLVLSFSTKPLTSGNVLRILTKLGVRSDASAVSKALSNNKSQFITTGTPIVYEMTGSTQSTFAESLIETKG